jgi:hypothetical protein
LEVETIIEGYIIKGRLLSLGDREIRAAQPDGQLTLSGLTEGLTNDPGDNSPIDPLQLSLHLA